MYSNVLKKYSKALSVFQKTKIALMDTLDDVQILSQMNKEQIFNLTEECASLDKIESQIKKQVSEINSLLGE